MGNKSVCFSGIKLFSTLCMLQKHMMALFRKIFV